MCRRINLHIWFDQHIFSDIYSIAFQKNRIGIDERVFSDKYMFAIIAVERSFYPDNFVDISKKWLEDLEFLLSPLEEISLHFLSKSLA